MSAETVGESTNDELVVQCTCSYLHHSVRFYWRDEDCSAYVEVSLDYERSFWTRLKVAWRYLWRDVCAYGDVAEILLKSSELEKIRAWADERTKKFQGPDA